MTEAEVIGDILQVTIDEDFTGTSTVTYEICNTDCNICSVATVHIQSSNSKFDEDILTPNEDGHNDVLVVTGYEEYEEIPNSSISVVNRWGQVVYTTENYSNDWPGDLNGDPSKPLPEGVYYYHLTLDSGVTTMGSRSILR